MSIDLVDEIEIPCVIDLNWYYHSVYYNHDRYVSIMTEGIKCNKLLKGVSSGVYNGLYYISLSKITIPDNICFLYYSSIKPSFILSGIDPIKCVNIEEYEQYIDTKDPRRMGNYEGEYQYYYFIDHSHIEGIVYNLLEKEQTKTRHEEDPIVQLQCIDSLLDELGLDIPVYDYSRRKKDEAHIFNREKIKYYAKKP